MIATWRDTGAESVYCEWVVCRFSRCKAYVECSAASPRTASLLEEGGDWELISNRIRDPYLAFQNQVNSKCVGRKLRGGSVRVHCDALTPVSVYCLASTCENAFPAPYGAFDGSGRPILPVLNVDPPVFMRRVLTEYFDYLWGQFTISPLFRYSSDPISEWQGGTLPVLWDDTPATDNDHSDSGGPTVDSLGFELKADLGPIIERERRPFPGM
jgi:hypothetical protein